MAEQRTPIELDVEMLPRSVSKPRTVLLDTGEDTAGTTATLDVPGIAREDVLKQRGQGVSVEELTSKFDAIINSPDAISAAQANDKNEFIGKRVITSDVLERAKNDDAFRGQLLSEYVASNSVPLAQPEEPVVPFEFGLPEELTKGVDATFVDVMNGVVESNVRVRDAMMGEYEHFGLNGKRLILNKFASGNTFHEAWREISNLPGDVARTPYILPLAYNGAMAVADAVAQGTFGERQFGDVLPEAFGKRMSESGFIKFGEKLLGGNVITDDRVAGLQRWYKSSFIREYGRDAWQSQHTEPLVEMSEAGRLEYKRDEDGNVMRKDVGLPPQVAGALLELTYNELPFISKAGILFSQQAGITFGAVKATTGAARNAANRVSDARARSADSSSADYGKYGPSMTDIQVLEELKKNDFADTNNAIAKAWYGTRDVTTKVLGYVPGVAQAGGYIARKRRKGQLNVGNNLTEINQNLRQYDANIAQINKEIDALLVPKDGRIPPDINDQVARLEKARDEMIRNRDNYRSTVGRNPYMRAAMRDEVIISSAIAAAETYLPDMDLYGVPSDIIVGVTAPLVTPAFAGFATRTVFKTGDAATEGLFTDVAELLENSDMFPFIPRNAILNADETAMRDAVSVAGFDLNDTRIKAFNQFNRILRAMPEDSRAEVHNALIRYTEMMDSYDADLRGLENLTDESRQEIMKNLHLSVAKASGLAPLIEYQQGKIEMVTAGKLTNTSDMAALIRATAEEQQISAGIDANIRIIRESLAKDGVTLEDNAPLQDFISDLESGSEARREALAVKQQQLVLLLDNYTKNIGVVNKDIDDTTVDDMFELAIELEEMSILPGGTVEGLINKGQIIEKAHGNMLEAAREQTSSLRAFAGNMERSEFIASSRKNADLLLDIAYGRRRALAKVEYDKVDEMLGGREFNLVNVVERMAKISGDIEDRPIAEQLTDFGKFLRSDGKSVLKTFNSMARRNLMKMGFSEEDLRKYIKQRREEDPEFDFYDVAVEAIKKDKDADAASLLSGTFGEAEDLYRFFELRGTGGKVDAAEINKVKGEMRRLITSAYGDLDPAVQKQIETARKVYRDQVGSRTDPKVDYAWMGPAIAGRQRKDPADRPETEGPYGYRNIDSTHPEVPFLRMAEISTELLNTRAGTAKHADLQKQLRKENDRVLYAIGGKRNKNGNMEFDLRDPSQRKALEIYKNLTEAHLQHRISRFYLEKTDIATEVLQEGMGDLPKDLDALDFNRAQRMFEIENEFSIDIIDENGNPDVIRGANFSEIDDFAIEFDTLLANNKKYQQEYRSLRDRLDPVNGVLSQAAKTDQEDMRRIIGQLDFDAKLVNRKEAFYDAYFANATPDSFARKVTELTNTSGLSRDEVMKAMKYMYVEGLFAKARRRTKTTATKDTPQMMTLEGEIFNEITSDPNQIKLMNEVLGPEHSKAIIRMRDWLSTAMGDGLDLKRGGASGLMTIESAFSRIFNVARGMVSPLYVGTELATRAMLINQQNLLDLALNDPQSAIIMGKILTSPDSLTKLEIKTLGIRMEAHIAKGVLKTGKNIATLEQVLEQEENLRTYGTILNPPPAEEAKEETEDENIQ